METAEKVSKKIIIKSIGTANPSCAKILEDSLKLPKELILKQLYNAPSVLFPNVDLELASELEKQLTKLGLEIALLDVDEKINYSNENYEVSINIQDIKYLPQVLKNLSEFLGTSIQECVQLLGDERRIVIGGVSKATSIALKKRIPASICYTNPKNDLYTVNFNNKLTDHDIRELTRSGIPKSKIDLKTDSLVGLDYTLSQKIWSKYHAQKDLKVINQSHQIISIEVTGFNLESPEHIEFLNKTVGIPSEVLPHIHKDLPVNLYDNIARHNAKEVIQKMDTSGIEFNISEVDISPKIIEASDIQDHQAFEKIINQFFDVKNKKKANQWKSESKVPHVIAMYIMDQLESIHCKVKMN